MGIGSLIVGAIVGLIRGIVVRLFNAITKAPAATLTFAYSVVGGLAATDCWIGHLIGWLINLLPWWAPYLAFLVGVAFIVGDVIREGVAERFAIYLSLIVPSLGMAIPKNAKLRQLLAGWIDQLNVWLNHHIGEWIGTTAQHSIMTLVALTAIAAAVLYNERYAKKLGASSITASGTTTSTTTPAVRRRRTAA